MNEEQVSKAGVAAACDDGERARWIDAAIDKALAQWPRIRTSKEDLVRHVETLGGNCGDLARFGPELYLACACLRGDPAALDALDREYVTRVAPMLTRFGTHEDFVQETIQLVRQRLLLPPEPRLATYAATGPLFTWLRVVSARIALGIRRNAHPPAEELRAEHVFDVPRVDASEVPRYRQALDAAVRRVFAELPVRERNLLKLHYLDGLNIDHLGRLYGVHRATIARWLAELRHRMLADIERDVSQRLRLSPSECRSVVGLLQSLLDASIERLLGVPQATT